MQAVERLDRFQRRHTWSGLPIAVVYKYVDDQGNYLAALITYYAFLSLFPLLLLLSTGLGVVLANDDRLRELVLSSALRQFPVIGEQLGHPQGLQGSGIGLALGAALSLYGALGVAQAVQNAMHVMWAIPRNKRPNPLLARLRSLVLIGSFGLALLGTTLLTWLGTTARAFDRQAGTALTVVAAGLAVLLNVGVFVLAFRVATARPLTRREVLPGAVAAAVFWAVLQSTGAAYVQHVVTAAGAVNGVFALVLGLVAFIYLEAVAVVLGVEINVVHSTHLYPRALLTPFTDDVDLTHADERAYAGYAEAQRTKGFETVDVDFDPDATSEQPDDPPGHTDDREERV